MNIFNSTVKSMGLLTTSAPRTIELWKGKIELQEMDRTMLAEINFPNTFGPKK